MMRLSALLQRSTLACGLAVVGACSLPALAAEPNPPKLFDIALDANFSGYRLALVSFLRTHHPHRVNTICILGEEATDGTRSAWVIWREGRKMLLWDGGSESMSSSRRLLDLKRDVVATTDDVKGSTYRVTRAWVDQQSKRCEQSGTNLQIRRAELK